MARPTAGFPSLLLAAALLGSACGTQHEVVEGGAPAGEPGYEEPSDYGSQSARTQAMESKAAELERRYREAMADPDATEQEKIRAYQEFERERQKLNEMSEGSGEEEPSDDEY